MTGGTTVETGTGAIAEAHAVIIDRMHPEMRATESLRGQQVEAKMQSSLHG